MVNPFEDVGDQFLVLVNNREEFSLWPAYLRVPAGWTILTGPDTRQACLDIIEKPENIGPRRKFDADVCAESSKDDNGAARSSRPRQE